MREVDWFIRSPLVPLTQTVQYKENTMEPNTLMEFNAQQVAAQLSKPIVKAGKVQKLVRHKLEGRDNMAYKNHTARSFESLDGEAEKGRVFKLLIAKLKEEVNEVAEEASGFDPETTTTPYALMEEVIDVLDVLKAIAKVADFDLELLESMRAEKDRRKGNFADKHVLYNATLRDL